MVRVGHELHVCMAAYGVIKDLMAVIRRHFKKGDGFTLLALAKGDPTPRRTGQHPALEWWS